MRTKGGARCRDRARGWALVYFCFLALGIYYDYWRYGDDLASKMIGQSTVGLSHSEVMKKMMPIGFSC